ncbi:MAG: hypothetical protein II220_01630 [Spirochaetales bacterium]|nr:hypothetical protein [Spirochaetales bacterium]
MISGGGGGKDLTNQDEELLQEERNFFIEQIKDFHRKSFYNALFEDYLQKCAKQSGYLPNNAEKEKSQERHAVHLDS